MRNASSQENIFVCNNFAYHFDAILNVLSSHFILESINMLVVFFFVILSLNIFLEVIASIPDLSRSNDVPKGMLKIRILALGCILIKVFLVETSRTHDLLN